MMPPAPSRLGQALALAILGHAGVLWATQRMLVSSPRPGPLPCIEVDLVVFPAPAPAVAAAPAAPAPQPPPDVEPPPRVPAPPTPVVVPPPLVVPPPPEATPTPAEPQPVTRVEVSSSLPAVSPPLVRPVVPAPVQVAMVRPPPVRTPPRVGAAYRRNPAPLYPESARRNGISGQVMLRVAVGVDGRPVRVDIAAGSGHSALDSAALRAVRRWTFEPAREGNAPVAAEVEVPIRFALE